MSKVQQMTLYRRSAWLAGTCLLGCSLAMAGGAKSAQKNSPPRYGVAVYSDLCLEADTGDIGGQRISLHRYADMDSLFYEYTAGALSLPVVASEVQIDDKTGVLTFAIAGQDGRERIIIGRFGERGQSLTLDGGYCADGSMAMRLARVDDFSRPLQSCKACPPGQEMPPPVAELPLASPMTPAQQPSHTLEQEEQLQRTAPARPGESKGARHD